MTNIATAARVNCYGDLPQSANQTPHEHREPEGGSLSEVLEKYVTQNLKQEVSETDLFTEERYAQFHRFLPRDAKSILDVGANTGRGGQRLAKLDLSYELTALDCVQSRLDALPKCYQQAICGLSNALPAEDESFDAIVAGEFLEHLYPSDVDPTLCEFQRILKVRGRLLMTTPNPDYVRTLVVGWNCLHCKPSHSTLAEYFENPAQDARFFPRQNIRIRQGEPIPRILFPNLGALRELSHYWRQILIASALVWTGDLEVISCSGRSYNILLVCGNTGIISTTPAQSHK